MLHLQTPLSNGIDSKHGSQSRQIQEKDALEQSDAFEKNRYGLRSFVLNS